MASGVVLPTQSLVVVRPLEPFSTLPQTSDRDCQQNTPEALSTGDLDAGALREFPRSWSLEGSRCF